MKELDEIDQLFQTTFEGFELTPDSSVKAHIDRALASKKKRRRFLFILFPVLFGTTTLAAMLYFYPISGKTTSDNRNSSQQPPSTQHQIASNNAVDQKNIGDTSFTNTSEKTPSIHCLLHSKEKISGRKNAILRPGLSDLSEKNSRTSYYLRSKQGFSNGRRNSAILRPDQPKPHLSFSTVTDTTSPQTRTLSTPIIKQPDPEEKPELAQASNQDSTKSDSTKTETLARFHETICDPLDIVTKKSINWFLAVVTGWEGEKKRAFEAFDTTNFAGKRKEFASIHSSSFYGKIEFNRVLPYRRLNLVAGIGFRSSKVTQYSSLYKRDSVIVHEGVSSTPSDSVTYFINHRTGSQTYRVNSISIPLGLSFSIPLNDQFQFRLSGGTELSFGWMTYHQILTEFSPPNFRSFGCNVWFRPEFHYTFGRYELFGFGSFNQALSQQLRWDFTMRRNPAFGAGIGLLIQL